MGIFLLIIFLSRAFSWSSTQGLQSGLKIFLSFNEKLTNECKSFTDVFNQNGNKDWEKIVQDLPTFHAAPLTKNQKRWLFCDFTKYNHTFFEFF